MDGDKSDKNVKRHKLVPPDGGWAYMIWIAAIINFSVTTMFLPSMGLIFNDFYIKLEMGSTDIQLVNGLNSVFVAVGGFMTGPLTKILTVRKLSFIGSTSLSFGIFGIVFVNSYTLLLMSQGILMGTGTGILYAISCTVLNDYFLEKRFIMTSLAQAIAAAAAMVTPLAVHWTAEHHGFRATLILMTAVYMQTLVGSALQQPVRWHLKKVPVGPETEELLESKPGVIQTKTEPFQVVDINIDQIAPTKNNGVLAYIKDLFDWPFLKQFLCTCACVGSPLGLVADVIFTLFLPQALYDKHWKEREVAWALSLFSFGDIAMRIFLIVASAWLKGVGNILIFLIGMGADAVFKLVMLWFPHPTVTYVTLTLAGSSRCLIMVLFSLVVSDAAPPEKYAVAYGVCVLFYGVFSITLGPAIGAVRDATGNYSLMLYLLTGIMAAVTLAWSVEIYCKKRRATSLNKS